MAFKFAASALAWRFFERLVRSVKDLLKKVLQKNKLNYEEMQTVLFEIELLLNNRPLTYVYSTDLESCLTPNHLLFGRRLELSSSQKSPISIESFDLTKHTSNVNKIIDHFWNRWRREYVVNLRESHKIFYRNKHQPEPSVNDIVLVYEEHLPRSMWRLGRILELIKGHDDRVRGAIVRSQNNSDLRRPVNKLYPIETMQMNDDGVQKDDMLNENKRHRNARIVGEIKRKFAV